MATLIPALRICTTHMTPGKRRLAERLEHKLDGDYLLWYDVPVGPRRLHPDFVVMHPRRGLLILEVKDWSAKTIHRASKQHWQLFYDRTLTTRPNPAEQARKYAHEIVEALQRDPQLTQADGPQQGQLAFPWSYGVAFPNLTRQQFLDAGFDQVIEPTRVLCSDEMLESVEPKELQSRLWGMFPHMMRGVMTPRQLARVRWILFTDMRVQSPGALFDDSDPNAPLPGVMRVMDLQQEQLARSLGDGHRVIHGVAGSGKTMILGHRAEHLAKAHTPAPKPILILCYNEPLAVTLAALMQSKGLASRVQAVHFHKWCRDQLVAFGQELPAANLPVGVKMDDMVQRVMDAVTRENIPSGQYQAILIDEGHDFAPEWLRLVTQMVDPATNSLLLLYDDAQSIYERTRTRQFSFKDVGVQAQGRTTILKVNYRNTRQILQTARLIAADLLTADDKDDDGIPLVQPVSCGRDGDEPIIVRLQTFREEAFKLAELLSAAHQDGYGWGDMAIICRHTWMRDECAGVLQLRGLPHEARTSTGTFNPGADSIKLLTMHACKGLEFAVVALPGVGHMPGAGENEHEEARLFYVAATRATERLIVTVSRTGAFGRRLIADK